MRVVQFETPEHGRRVGMVIGNEVCDLTSAVPAWSRVIDVFHAARQSSRNFSETVTDALEAERLERLDYSELLVAEPHGGQPWLCAPVDHADGHRVLISGTGLTHTGGMKSRDQMHSSDTAATVPQTDSARMFQIGIDGGNPSAGVRGAAPEWFYKGNGYNLRGPNSALEIPEFALDGGEEPEVAAVYVIGDDGVPYRLVRSPVRKAELPVPRPLKTAMLCDRSRTGDGHQFFIPRSAVHRQTRGTDDI